MLQLLNKLVQSESCILDLVRKNNLSCRNVLITYFDQRSFNLTFSNIQYKRLLETVFTLYADGTGIFLGLKFLGKFNFLKIVSTDLNSKILSIIIDKNTSVFIIGGNFNQVLLMQRARMNGINLVGYQKGFFKAEEKVEIFNQIIQRKAKTIFIGMGVPNQEVLASELNNCFNGITIICVGNFFNYYFGFQKRAPQFLRKHGLEWLYRLFANPKRLWKRYIFGIPLFFYRILRIYFQKNQSYEDVS